MSQSEASRLMASLRKGEEKSAARTVGVRGGEVEPWLVQPGGGCRLPPELRKPASEYWRRRCTRRTLSEEKGDFTARSMHNVDREQAITSGVAIYPRHFYEKVACSHVLGAELP